ncbi:MAG TPA: TonB-dependent receptor, partial [Cyclobacteriaceae bacterium]|nr:TonB-dependent receptor [Cyclobacteriaceae bacterium]
LRWNTVLSEKLYANATAIYSKYQNSISGLNATKGFDANFGIDMRGIKADLTYALNAQNRIDFGGSMTDYVFNNGNLTPRTNSSINPISVPEEYSRETGIYISDELKISPAVSVSGGLRYSLYNVYGQADVFLYQEGIPKEPGTVTGVLHFGSGQKIKQYDGWEPRFMTKVSINEKSSVKFSYNRNYQYLQLISNTTAISPLDLWKTSNYYIKPQIGDQVAIGYFRNLNQNKYELSVEGYYKEIQNLVEYKDGANLFMNRYLESQLLNAHGQMYGVEFLLKKKEGKLTGWLSYTYSRSFRVTKGNTQEETINQGDKYPSNFDKPHNFVTVANYAFTKRLSLSANFTYSTGRPTTYPESVYLIDGYAVSQFTQRNQARIPDYHRLDLSFTIEQSLIRNKKWKGSWVFSIYNVYGRANAYSVFLRPQYKGYQTQAYQLAVVGTVFPSITYNFKF